MTAADPAGWFCLPADLDITHGEPGKFSGSFPKPESAPGVVLPPDQLDPLDGDGAP